MEPPSRHHTTQKSETVPLSFTTPDPKSVQAGIETRPPRTSQTISVGWEEDDIVSRIRIADECVETKTVTTTTTTKRSWPPLLLPKKSLESLDPKEYPLAQKELPSQLTNFSFQLHDSTKRSQESKQETTTFGPKQSIFNPKLPTELSTYDSMDYRTPDSDTKKKERLLALSKKWSSRDNKRPTADLADEASKSLSRVYDEQRKMRLQLSHPKSAAGKAKGQSIDRTRRTQGTGVIPDTDGFPATPDMSEVEVIPNAHKRTTVPRLDTFTPLSSMSQNDSFDDVESQPDPLDEEAFASAVATPPIAESDLEHVENPLGLAIGHVSTQRQSLNTNASLPSPGLSPTYYGGDDEDVDEDFDTPGYMMPGSDTQQNSSGLRWRHRESSPTYSNRPPSVLETGRMLESFEAMPNEMKTFMMCQFLKSCSKKSLHVIADLVNPALKCDYLDQFPLELSHIILSFLDHRDRSRAAQVSKRWRNIIDSDERGWKELFDRDKYVLSVGELEKAIKQGWGWQDPFGLDGYERDLSVPETILSSETENSYGASRKPEVDTIRKSLRSGVKRKSARTVSSDRAKRRATEHTAADKEPKINSIKYDKGAGPLAAANAAVLAVPDPQEGLPSLRTLHLFKSLYRRHYLLKRAWTGGKVKPHHFAFLAHPSHVITCLQFDDDKILTGSDDTLIHVYDTKTGTLRKKLEGHEGGVWALQYEGNVLVSGSTDRSVRVWDIEKGLCTQVFHGHTSTVRCLQILMPEATGRFDNGKPVMSPSKPLIITGSRDSQLRVWKLPEQGSKRYIQANPPANDADCPYFVRVLAGHSHSVRAIAANQDTLVSGSYDNTVRVWKISTGETVHRLQGHSMKVYSVVLDNKRNRCISGSMDNFVKVWSLETGQCLFTLEGHTSLVGLLDLQDERLVSAAADSTLRIWDPENGQCKSTLTAHTGAITCFQHDGQKVISGSDRTLKMWDVKTGECTKDLLTDLSGVWQVKFDERRCVAAVQRDNRTFVEVIDFGASRDGVPASRRGFRDVLDLDGQGNLDDERFEEVEEEP